MWRYFKDFDILQAERSGKEKNYRLEIEDNQVYVIQDLTKIELTKEMLKGLEITHFYKLNKINLEAIRVTAEDNRILIEPLVVIHA